MKKTTIHGKYQGPVEFNEKRQGISVIMMEKYLKIARVYRAKSGKFKGDVRIQLHPHGAVERAMHKTNDWIPLPPDLILPLIKMLQEWYVVLNEEELPETRAFEKVSKEKELSKDIEDIGL